MNKILFIPFLLIFLSSCSSGKELNSELKSELKEELKSELKEELKSELKSELKEELISSPKKGVIKNNEFNLKIVDQDLLGISNFTTEKPSYGGCSFSGNFKFNIKVPKNFTGSISDIEATYLYKGVEHVGSFYDDFVDGKSINGAYVSEYISEDEMLTKLGSKICSINSSDDIKLKSFSKKTFVLEGIKPSLK